MRLADGVLLVVDAAEGVMAVTERAVRQAVAEGLSVTLLISKVGCGVCGGGREEGREGGGGLRGSLCNGVCGREGCGVLLRAYWVGPACWG